jgi:uncharacterized protein involved in exopolysaccharide biosynthesis
MTNDQGQEGIDFKAHLAVLSRYKWLILTFCVSAGLTSLALTYVLSEKYLAYTTVLYQPIEAVSFRPKDREALGFPTPAVSLESIGSTLDELVKGDATLEHVVRTLQLDVKRPRPASSWLVETFRSVKDTGKEYMGNTWEILRYGRLIEKDPFARAIADLRRNVSTERTAKAYTFQVAALDSDPVLAATIVDTVAERLRDFLADDRLRLARETREGLEKRLVDNERETAALRNQLDAFKRDANVSSLSEELSLQLKTVASFEEESTRVRNDLRALRMKRAEQERQLAVEQQLVKYDSTSTQNPIVEELRLQLAKLEVERSGLLGKFTEEHRQVKSIDAQMAQIRTKLASEAATVVSAESMRANDIYQKLLSEKLASDAEIESLTARLEAYNRSIVEDVGTARTLTAKEQELGDLALRLAGSERSYVLITEAIEEARIAESKGASELSVLHKALVPKAPARPIKILHVGVTLALSLMLSIGLAFVVGFLDTSIRRPEQIERVLQLPVLTTVPALPANLAGRLLFKPPPT